MNPVQFPFVPRGVVGKPVPDLAPIAPILLSRDGRSISTSVLVDSGADVSVLPFSFGSQFGVDWDSLVVPCSIGGGTGSIPGKLISVAGTLASFPPVQLIFAWMKSDRVPRVLGQSNFFLEFDVCFFRSQNYFQIQPRTP
jgi:hypothetical protein